MMNKNNTLFLILFIAMLLLNLFNNTKVYADNFNTGLIELNSKNYDNAIMHFQQALRQDPYHIKAYNNLGMALKKKGDFDNAILSYQQAIKIDPRYGIAYYNLGLCLKDAKRSTEAIEALQAFINFNPEDSEAIRSKWIANDLREELDDPGKQTRKYYLGSYLISDRNYQDAIPPLQEAVSLDPNDVKARYALGLAYKRNDQYQEAIQEFTTLLQQNNQNPLAYYELGECYEALGNGAAAGQAYQNYVTLAPYAESTKKLQSKFNGMQQQNTMMQQQNYMQNTMQQNTVPAYQAASQPTSQSAIPYAPAQQNNNIPYATQPVQNQQQQQYQQPQLQSQGMVPGLTAVSNSMNQNTNNNVVPQFGQPQSSFGAGFSGPSMGTPAARTGKTRVAVLDFDYSGVRPWWNGQWDIGKGVASLITSELVRSGVYSVIERSALDQILQEQKLSNSQLFDASTAANIGKLLGVDVLVMGNITQFGIENKKKGFGSAIPFVAIAANIQSKKSIASVAFDMRMVSVDTGEILDVASILGKSKRRGLMLDFARGGNAGGIDFSSSNFQDSVLGEASMAAAQRATEIVNTKYEKITRATIGSSTQDIGVVAYVGAQGVIINAGNNAGIKIGNRLSIERMTDVVRDPMSGQVIKALTSPVGELEITEIEENSATGKMLSGSYPQVGDLARFRPDMNVVVPAEGAETSVTAEIMYKKPKK
jgi:curli biogenesis system outer membrane secretion channel CsgG/Flp pilus assembly protein TadD